MPYLQGAIDKNDFNHKIWLALSDFFLPGGGMGRVQPGDQEASLTSPPLRPELCNTCPLGVEAQHNYSTHAHHKTADDLHASLLHKRRDTIRSPMNLVLVFQVIFLFLQLHAK